MSQNSQEEYNEEEEMADHDWATQIAAVDVGCNKAADGAAEWRDLPCADRFEEQEDCQGHRKGKRTVAWIDEDGRQ